MHDEEKQEEKNKKTTDQTYAGTGTDGGTTSTPRDADTQDKPGFWEQIKDDLLGGGDGDGGGWDFGGGDGGGDGGGGD